MSGKKADSKKNGAAMPPELHGRSFIINDSMPFSIKEEYKTLRTNILLSIPSEGCKVIGITSAQPLEGKSINCLNIAITFAQTDANVLLIDCDLRVPSQASLVGADAVPGLSNVLVGMNTVDEAIRKTDYPKVDVLLSGNIPPNPTELLSSSSMSRIIETLSKRYDYIFIDLPPINLVADTLIMSKYVSGMLLIIRSGVSGHDSVIEAIKRLELAKANIIGVLLTCVKGKKLPAGRY